MSSEEYEENTVPSLTPFTVGGKSPAGGANGGTFMGGQASPSSPNRPSRKRSSVRKTSCLYTKTPTPFAQGSSPTSADVIANLREGHSPIGTIAAINPSSTFIASPLLTIGAVAGHPEMPMMNLTPGGVAPAGAGDNPGGGGGIEPTIGILGDQSAVSNPQAGTATGNIPPQYTL